MRESLKERINTVITGINRRVAAGQPIGEALAELRRLAGVAWEEGFTAGRYSGGIRPSNPVTVDPTDNIPKQRRDLVPLVCDNCGATANVARALVDITDSGATNWCCQECHGPMVLR